MLETKLILQLNIYNLTWHPMWRVPHQQLKHQITNSTLTFNINKSFKF
jgi:hypothetical protein